MPDTRHEEVGSNYPIRQHIRRIMIQKNFLWKENENQRGWRAPRNQDFPDTTGLAAHELTETEAPCPRPVWLPLDGVLELREADICPRS